MRVLVILAHPLEDSYGAALRDVVIQSLKAGDHTVDLCDLYREAFDPVLSAREWQMYRDNSGLSLGSGYQRDDEVDYGRDRQDGCGKRGDPGRSAPPGHAHDDR